MGTVTGKFIFRICVSIKYYYNRRKRMCEGKEGQNTMIVITIMMIIKFSNNNNEKTKTKGEGENNFKK